MKVKSIYIFSFMLWSPLLTQAQWTTADLSEPRVGLVAGSTGAKVLFAGGSNSSGSPSDVVDIYDNVTNTWSTTTLSIGRSTLAVAATTTKVFFGGGFIFNGVDSDVVDIFDSNTSTWSTSHLSLARHYLAATSSGAKVFFAGGVSNNVVSDVVDVYDLSTGEWSVAHLSQPRLALTAVANGTKVFFSGGYDIINDQQVYSDVVDIYDIEANTWTTTNLSEARGYLASTSIGSKVFFAGGHGTSNPSNVIDIYDTTTDSWSSETLSQSRNGLSATSNGVEVFFAGGYNDSGNSDVVDIYNSTTNSWTTSNLSLARNFLAAASVGTKVIFAGGYNSGVQSTVDMYENACLAYTLNISGDIAICLGSSTILTATGANSYTWSPADGLSATTGNSVTANPTQNTTYTVIGTNPGNCSSTKSTTVTIHPLPIANAGQDVEICEGNSTTLSASGGVSYDWSPAAGLSNTDIFNPVANPTTMTEYTVMVTDANQCSATDKVVVTVNPLPTANAGQDVEICEGSSTTLSASGGVSFDWSPAAGLSNTNIFNPVASPITLTTYSVLVTDENGCSDTDEIEITINPLPSKPVITSSQLNSESLRLTSSSTSGNQWFKNENLLIGLTDQILDVTDNGVYTVQVSQNECVSPMSDPFSIIITAIWENPKSSNFRIYPNPAEQIVYVEGEGIVNDKSMEVKITDLLGRVVLTKILKEKENTIEIGNLNSGVYLMQIIQLNNKVFAKFQKR